VRRHTEVSTESESFEGSVSDANDATEAVLVIVPGWVGLTTISTTAVAPLATVSISHVTLRSDSVQEPWVGLAETNETLSGSASVTRTPGAGSGPSFPTVKV
jgi:hypothetical protein